MDKIKNNLAQIVTLIGIVSAIGAGFAKFGQMEEKLANYEPFNPDSLIGEMGKQSNRIVVLEKQVQYLELEIKELKATSKNPLAN